MTQVRQGAPGDGVKSVERMRASVMRLLTNLVNDVDDMTYVRRAAVLVRAEEASLRRERGGDD